MDTGRRQGQLGTKASPVAGSKPGGGRVWAIISGQASSRVCLESLKKDSLKSVGDA